MSAEIFSMLAIGAVICGLILASFRSLRSEVGKLRDDMGKQNSELRSEMAQLGSELRSEMAQQRDEFRSEMAQQRSDIDALREDFHKFREDMARELRALSERVAKLEGLLEGLRESFRREHEAA